MKRIDHPLRARLEVRQPRSQRTGKRVAATRGASTIISGQGRQRYSAEPNTHITKKPPPITDGLGNGQ
jgi:hypothetical protein